MASGSEGLGLGVIRGFDPGPKHRRSVQTSRDTKALGKGKSGYRLGFKTGRYTV